MEITEVRVKLVDGGQDKLRAFCSITIDDSFVVRDLKVIEGTKGLFVAMPSRKLTTRCQRCGFKNQVRSNYCNECGTTLPPESSQRLDGKAKLHADIAHPINTECRERLQARVVESYLEEVDASQQPGYRPRDLDDADEDYSAESAAEGSRGEGLGARATARGAAPATERSTARAIDRIPERAPERAPERTSERGAEGPRERGGAPAGVPAGVPAFDRAPILADRGYAERTPIERAATDRTVERGPSVRGPSERSVPERGVPERSVAERSVPERSVAERDVPERSVAERSVPERSAPERSAPERSVSHRPATERVSGDRLATDAPRRPSARERGPLAGMPPPDDNFSAGIF